MALVRLNHIFKIAIVLDVRLGEFIDALSCVFISTFDLDIIVELELAGLFLHTVGIVEILEPIHIKMSIRAHLDLWEGFRLSAKIIGHLLITVGN